MTQRERLLAIAVGVIVLLVGGQYLFSSLSTTLQKKQDAVDSAAAELSSQELVVKKGQKAAEKINALVPKSLPKDPELLADQYRDWLYELASEVGMNGTAIVVPKQAIRKNDAYSAYKFSLTGFCRSDRVLDLMGKFYDKDYLHSIINLSWSPDSKDPNLLKVVLDAEAIALNDAPETKEASQESSGRLAMSIEEYKDVILSRNPFSPPNQPPKIETDRVVEIERGSRWSLPLKATDPEGSSGMDWELVSEEVPDWLRYRDGEFSGSPQENGETEVVVRVTDRSYPPASAEQKLVFKVVDPPEKPVEPPKFDVASQAFVTALIGGRNGSEVWIFSRTEGKKLELKQGDDFEIGSIKAKVIDINLKEDYVELETDGAHWMVDQDASLADAYLKSQIN